MAHDGIAPRDGDGCGCENDPSQTLVVAGCDPAAGLLASEYTRQTGRRMIHLCRSSGRALRLLQQRRIHVAGVHLSAAGGGDGNANIVSRELAVPAALLRLAQWEEGVAFVSDQRAASLRGLLRRPLRWIGREPGSGARQCLNQLLRLRKQPSQIATDHRAVATVLSWRLGRRGRVRPTRQRGSRSAIPVGPRRKLRSEFFEIGRIRPASASAGPGRAFGGVSATARRTARIRRRRDGRSRVDSLASEPK